MELFIPHDCDNCGFTGESKLLFRGPHIQQRCPSCNKHIKFISKSCIPDYREIKQAIWRFTTDLVFLEKLKSQIGFNESYVGLERDMCYWKLYQKVRVECGVDSVIGEFE